MGKIAYLDLRSGISGDMLLGSLIDLGADVKILDDVIRDLELKDVHIEIEERYEGISGKDIKVRFKDQPERKLSDILRMIEEADLKDEIKRSSSEAFETLGKVESEIHDVEFEELSLHETGMVDSIVDVVGSVALFDDLDIDKAYSSTVHTGSGYTQCEHGKIPVPVPATSKILERWKVRFTQKEGELVTPTGAALLQVLTEQRNPPDMTLEKVGTGFGDRRTEEPNALRVFLGKKSNVEQEVQTCKFYVDDTTPEILGYNLDKIREQAIDAYSVPAVGKKGRQGWEVVVVMKRSSAEEVIETIMKETSTLGMRIEDSRRLVQERRIDTVETKWGEVGVKVAKGKDSVQPEYEDCRKIAEEKDVPLKEVYQEVKKKYYKEEK